MQPAQLLQQCSSLQRSLKSNYLFAPDCAERALICSVLKSRLACCQVAPRESVDLDRRKALSGPKKSQRIVHLLQTKDNSGGQQHGSSGTCLGRRRFRPSQSATPGGNAFFRPCEWATGKESEASKRRRSQADRKGRGCGFLCLIPSGSSRPVWAG